MTIKISRIEERSYGDLFLTRNIGPSGNRINLGDEIIFTNIGPNRQYTAYGKYAGLETQGYGGLVMNECIELPFIIDMETVLRMEENSKSKPAEKLVNFLRNSMGNLRNNIKHSVSNSWHVYLVEEG